MELKQPVPAQQAGKFTVMWHRDGPKVLAYALRHVESAMAEDVLAETFLVAWRRFSEIPEQPLPWLLVVARNTMANMRRSARRQVALQEQMVQVQRLAEPAPAAEVSAAHRAEGLEALATLPPAQREALLLVHWDGLSPAQAARVAGCPTATFYVRLFHARRHLRAHRETDDASSFPTPEPVRTT